MNLFTPNQEKFIKENVKGVTNADLTQMINEKFSTNFSVKQVKGYKSNHKLSSGLTGRFEKGHIPFSKGKKWDEFMPKSSQAKSRKTTFKKGQKPINYRPVGSERINVNGYTEVKIKDPNVWKLKHQIIYEERNGPILPGFKIIFKDGNRQNLDINNLECISDQEELIINKHHLRYEDKELTETGILIAKVIDKKNKLVKNEK